MEGIFWKFNLFCKINLQAKSENTLLLSESLVRQLHWPNSSLFMQISYMYSSNTKEVYEI